MWWGERRTATDAWIEFVDLEAARRGGGREVEDV